MLFSVSTGGDGESRWGGGRLGGGLVDSDPQVAVNLEDKTRYREWRESWERGGRVRLRVGEGPWGLG